MLAFPGEAAEISHYDVVFIAIEDFSPHRLNCYGGPVHSPNMDRLASEGVLFEKAYAMVPVCNASRTSLLTGLRPETTKIFGNQQDWRKALPGISTMPMHFRKHGYETVRIGKMYHGQWEHDASWSRVIPQLHDRTAARPKKRGIGPRARPTRKTRVKLIWGPTGVAPELDRDGQLATQAIRYLEQDHDKPYFLGIGFHGPHLPFRAPDRFHDLYPPEKILLPRNPPDDLKDTPIKGPHGDQEQLNEKEWREITAAHYATISYADWCVGRVLAAIRRTGREDRTIVIVWSDHGFMLGEHFLWRKGPLYEESVRVAWIWKVPGITPGGARCKRPVETIDTFPTLFDLCGIPRSDKAEGISMKPLLKDPSRPWKRGAISWSAGNGAVAAFQTERFRLNRRTSDGFLELYDHKKDPKEFTNVAGDPDYSNDLKKLTGLLDGGWKVCLPEGYK